MATPLSIGRYTCRRPGRAMPCGWRGAMCQRPRALPPSRRWLGMITRAIEAGVPFAWVAADSVYGVGRIEVALRRAGKGYVLGVGANSQFNSWIGQPAVSGTAAEVEI